MAGRDEATTIRGALARAVKAAREEKRIGPVDEVQVLIADGLAREADAAKGPEFLRAVSQFQRALDRLPLGEPVEVPAPTPGGSGDRGDDGRGRVLELLDRPAEVGDTAHA